MRPPPPSRSTISRTGAWLCERPIRRTGGASSSPSPPTGAKVVASIDDVEDPAPSPFAALSQTELETMAKILAKLTGG